MLVVSDVFIKSGVEPISGCFCQLEKQSTNHILGKGIKTRKRLRMTQFLNDILQGDILQCVYEYDIERCSQKAQSIN